MREHDPGLYGRSFADVYDAWYSNLEAPSLVVQAVADRCRAGSTVVEFGAGTGRLAMPLHDAGFDVIGVDFSLPMLRQARPDVSVIAADMSCTALRGASSDAVIIAYNTLLNLSSGELMLACLAEVARVLRSDGLVAIENFVAFEHPGSAIGISTRTHHQRSDARVAILTEHRRKPDGETEIIGTHVELLPEGTLVRPWRLAYVSPAELDVLAGRAGLDLIERHCDWVGGSFDAEADRHVSWYRHSR